MNSVNNEQIYQPLDIYGNMSDAERTAAVLANYLEELQKRDAVLEEIFASGGGHAQWDWF